MSLIRAGCSTCSAIRCPGLRPHGVDLRGADGGPGDPHGDRETDVEFGSYAELPAQHPERPDVDWASVLAGSSGNGMPDITTGTTVAGEGNRDRTNSAIDDVFEDEDSLSMGLMLI